MSWAGTLLRALTVVTAGAAACFATWNLALEFQSAGTLGLATKIVEGKVIGKIAAVKSVTAPPPDVSGPTCRSDFILARGFVSASVLDAVIAAGAIESVGPALRRLEATARDILGCSPGTGVAWAWLALARDQSGGTTEEIRSYLQRSQWTSPSDYWVLRLRLVQAATIGSRRGAAPFENIVRADVRTLLEGEVDEYAVGEILGPIFPWIRQVVTSEFDRIDDAPRRFGLMQTMGRWSANIANCDGRRFNDWLYRGMHGTCEEGDRIPELDWKKNRP